MYLTAVVFVHQQGAVREAIADHADLDTHLATGTLPQAPLCTACRGLFIHIYSIYLYIIQKGTEYEYDSIQYIQYNTQLCSKKYFD